jgi:hypothetical protein
MPARNRMAELHFTQNLRRHTACPSVQLQAGTVAELFRLYFTAHPGMRNFILDDQGEVRKHVKILVDGRNIEDRTRLGDSLTAASQVHVFQALSGG